MKIKLSSKFFELEALFVATSNRGKLIELCEMLSSYALSVKSTNDIPIDDIEETGSTFEDNALLKAKSAANQTGFISIADDSGLCIEALGGAPGIYSARYAIQKGGYELAFADLEARLQNKNTSAFLYTAIAVVVPPRYDCNTDSQGVSQVFVGRIDGNLVFPARGNTGFGYDSIFKPKGYDKTFAQLDASVKNSISHRFKALKAMLTYMLEF